MMLSLCLMVVVITIHLYAHQMEFTGVVFQFLNYTVKMHLILQLG